MGIISDQNCDFKEYGYESQQSVVAFGFKILSDFTNVLASGHKKILAAFSYKFILLMISGHYRNNLLFCYFYCNEERFSENSK